MANLTKEQRAKREAEKEAQLRAELEAQIKADLEEKLRAEYEAKADESKTADKKATAKKVQKIAKIPLDTIVPVVCNVDGGAIYHSKKSNGYIVEWSDYGSVEYVELGELVSMRNTARRFFEDNWIILEDTDEYTALQLYDFLKVTKLYENSFTPETLESIFDMEPGDIIKKVSGFSKGVKDTIATRAKIKIDAKELDSNKKIEALEQALNVTFSI